ENADGQGTTESDRPAQHVVAERTNSEVHEQKSRDDAGVAEDETVFAERIGEGQGCDHEQGYDRAGDETERPDCFFHWKWGWRCRHSAFARRSARHPFG